MGELVARTDHEVFESIIGIEVGIEEVSVFGLPLLGRATDEWRGCFVDDVFNLVGFIEKGLRDSVDQACVVKGEPVFEIRIRNLDIEGIRFLTDVNRGRKPGLVTVLIYLLLDLIEDFEPRIMFIFTFHLLC